MKLKCISTGSVGNCYLLTNASNQTLILDCGVSIKEIQRGLDYNIKDVAGAIISHVHGDHVKAAVDLKRLGIPVWKPFESVSKAVKMGEFTIRCFSLPHNGTPNYGFLIKTDGQKNIVHDGF